MSDHGDKHDEQGEHGGSAHGGGGHAGAHGGGGHAEGEHEGAPEWLISFADNVALMMGFFVILLAMNMGPKGSSAAAPSPDSYTGKDAPDMVDFVISIREAFNNPIDMSGSDSGEAVFRKRIIERTGGEGVDDAPKGRMQESQATRPSEYRQITALIPFDDASAVLSPGGRETIIETARKIRDQGWIIEVRGHASQFEAKRTLETGMKLSYDRALVVLRALMEGGVKRENLRIVACSDHDQVAGKTFSRDNARTNQRVEVVVTNETVSPDAFSTVQKTDSKNAPPASVHEPSKPDAAPMHEESAGGH